MTTFYTNTRYDTIDDGCNIAQGKCTQKRGKHKTTATNGRLVSVSRHFDLNYFKRVLRL